MTAAPYMLKVVVLGSADAGKTCLIQRIVDDKNHFDSPMTATVGVDFRILHRKIHNQPYKVWLWDTAGQEKYMSIVTNYWRGADLALVCYDQSGCNTLQQTLDTWLEPVQGAIPDYCRLVLLGCKNDKAHDAYQTELRQEKKRIADFFGNRVHSTSSLTNSAEELCKLLDPHFVYAASSKNKRQLLLASQSGLLSVGQDYPFKKKDACCNGT